MKVASDYEFGKCVDIVPVGKSFGVKVGDKKIGPLHQTWGDAHNLADIEAEKMFGAPICDWTGNN